MVILQPIKPGATRLSLSSATRLSLSNVKRGRARQALSFLGTNNKQQNLQLADSLTTISAEAFKDKWNFDPIHGIPIPNRRFQWAEVGRTPAMTGSWPPTPPPSPPEATAMTATSSVTSCDSETSSTVDPVLRHPVEDNTAQKTCVTLPPSGATTNATTTPTSSSTPASHSCKVTGGQSTSDMTSSTSKQSDSSALCSRTTCACDVSDCDRKNNSVTSHICHPKQVSEGDKTLSPVEQELISVSSSSAESANPPKEEEEEEGSQQNQSTTNTLRQTCITDFVRPKKLANFKVPETMTHSSSYSKKRPASTLQDQLNQPPHKKVLLHLRA